MKISFFETTPEEQEIIQALMPGVESTFFNEKLTSDSLDGVAAAAKDSEVVCVFINSTISPEVIDALPALRLIVTRSTGYDHVDVAYAKSKGIVVSNVPSYGSRTVAEFTFALMLNLSRKLVDASNQIRENGNFDISAFRGFDLFGKTLGVVGTGRIGKNVIRIAKAFGMNVVAFDLFPDEKFAQENAFSYAALDAVLSTSDVVTIHTPYTKETYHLINKDNIKLFKKGAYLINTARGEIVDTDALVWALENKIIAGAGLDVLEGERKLKEEEDFLKDAQMPVGADKGRDFKTLLEDHMLIDMPNVIVTPHIAFSSREAEAEILKTSVENILGFIKGSPQNNVIK